MLKLKFNLRHQDIQLVNKGATVATDSKDYLVAKFNTISDDWETPLTAVFTDDKHKQPYAVIVGADERLAENECFVPWEVLTDAANVYVSVYCGNLHTTVTAAFKVRKSGYIEGETPPPPSPTVYDIIIQSIENLRTGKQDKLTAGDNITIEDGVISASGGGTTDYNELENLPKVVASDVGIPFKGKMLFDNFFFPESTDNQIHLKIKNDTISREMLATALNNSLFTSYGILQNIPYDFFTNPSKSPIQNGVWEINRTDLEGMPIPAIGYLFNYYVDGGRIQFYLTDRYNGEEKAYRLFQRVQYMASFSEWEELTGGSSEIVSGVVNQNGTITFTDSDGNTFTTTGASVIGPQGDDYVLTPQDKTDIANIVLQLLPTTQGVLYGN